MSCEITLTNHMCNYTDRVITTKHQNSTGHKICNSHYPRIKNNGEKNPRSFILFCGYAILHKIQICSCNQMLKNNFISLRVRLCLHCQTLRLMHYIDAHIKIDFFIFSTRKIELVKFAILNHLNSVNKKFVL